MKVAKTKMAKTKMTGNMLNIFCLTLLSAGFVGCGGTGQDMGSASTHDQTFGGVVIDGYVARATVFFDTNNDGTRNGWEPFAFTDNDGYYSYNPLTNTNYCAADATAEHAQYCLRSNTVFSNVVVRISGGYDVSTGEPFVGQLSHRMRDISSVAAPDIIISPLTSLLINTDNDVNRTRILNTLNLSLSDLEVDYLNTDGSGAVDARIFNSALKVHKVVSVLGDRITDTYRDIGNETGTPNDATSLVYEALANQLVNTETNFDSTVADTAAMAEVLDTAEAGIRAIYQRQELTLPADMGSVATPGNFSRVTAVASHVLSLVNSVIPPTRVGTTRQQALSMARAVETVVIKALQETSTEDSSIERVAELFSDAQNSETAASLLTALSDPAADITALARNNFTDFTNLVESAVLPQDAMPFTQIGGMRIKVSNLDLGRAPDDLKDSEVEWYFHGDANDLSGTFTACVKHVDGASTLDGSLGEGSTRGELVSGFWSMLGASSESIESFSLLVTLEFLGSAYQAIIKPAGLDVVNGETYEKVRFDFDGEVKAWHSLEGMAPVTNVPSSNTECRANLPSRIGL